MADDTDPKIDPQSTQPVGDIERFARRRVGPAKFALAVLLAVLITAVSFMIVAVLLWGVASIFH